MNHLSGQKPVAPAAGQALAQATNAALEAAENSQQLQIIAAILQAQAITQAAQPQQGHVCQHHAHKQFDAKKWWTIGGLAVVGCCAACALAMAFAVAMTAVAIGGTCATACLLVLRSMWRQYMTDKH